MPRQRLQAAIALLVLLTGQAVCAWHVGHSDEAPAEKSTCAICCCHSLAVAPSVIATSVTAPAAACDLVVFPSQLAPPPGGRRTVGPRAPPALIPA